MQYGNRGHDLGDDSAGWLGRRSDSYTPSAALHKLYHRIALVRIQAAKLVLHVNTSLAAEIYEIFAL
jgi:hypothetical protein